VTTQFQVTPSAARLTESLRDIGYDFASAVADIVDNSIAAGARRVEVDIEFDGADSRVFIADDGSGMTSSALNEALRFGTRRTYVKDELGRYGLGLKTASLSQCRCVTVASRTSTQSGRKVVRMLDLDLIEEWDDWLIVDPGQDKHVSRARAKLRDGSGTVVLWRGLDRVLPEKNPDGGWARRRLETLASRTVEHLAMVFHRYLEGTTADGLTITVNGEKVRPWNPFATDEPACQTLPRLEFEVVVGDHAGIVHLDRHVLPSRDRFTDPDDFDRLSGPLKWNRQQGLYIYRSGRLVQWGGWAGIRAIDEHTKLARAALMFDTDLDAVFNINVAKMRVTIPPQLRQMLEQPVNELCIRADAAYRKTARRDAGPVVATAVAPPAIVPAPREHDGTRPTAGSMRSAGLALRSAAMQAGEYKAFRRIAAALVEHAPEVAESLDLRP
jgi:hypothetical protein